MRAKQEEITEQKLSVLAMTAQRQNPRRKHSVYKTIKQKVFTCGERLELALSTSSCGRFCAAHPSAYITRIALSSWSIIEVRESPLRTLRGGGAKELVFRRAKKRQ